MSENILWTVNVVGNGTVTKNPDQPIYSAGTNVTLTAVNGSQTFSEWSGDLTGNTNPTVIVMDGNKSVTATFVAPELVARMDVPEGSYFEPCFWCGHELPNAAPGR